MEASAFSRIRLLDHGVSRFVLYFLVLLLSPPIATGQSGPSQDSSDGGSFGPIVSRKTATSFIILVSVFFILGLFTVYARHCIGNRRRAGGLPVDQETAGGRTTMAARGLDKAAIASFPTFAYSSVKQLKIGKGSLECAVCLNEFEDDERLRLLPKCSHVFHSDCVDTWLTSHSTCPLCRDNLVPVTAHGYLSFSSSVHSDHDSGAGGAGDRSLPNESDNRTAIHVVENTNPNPNPNPNQTNSNLCPLPHRPVRSRSTGWRFNEIFLRSHTTSHSLVKPIENYERFTLRLPEEVRSQLLNSTASLNRARSCVGLGGMQSSRQGLRTGSRSGKNLILPTNQIDRWRFFLQNGPGMTQNSEFKVNEDAGERSFSRLRPPGDVKS